VANKASKVDKAIITAGDFRITMIQRAQSIVNEIKGTTLCVKRGMKLLALVRAHVSSKESKKDFRAWSREKARYKMDLYLYDVLERSIREFKMTGSLRNLYQFFAMAHGAVKKEITDAEEEIISLSAAA
jgi:hypothetical protein